MRKLVAIILSGCCIVCLFSSCSHIQDYQQVSYDNTLSPLYVEGSNAAVEEHKETSSTASMQGIEPTSEELNFSAEQPNKSDTLSAIASSEVEEPQLNSKEEQNVKVPAFERQNIDGGSYIVSENWEASYSMFGQDGTAEYSIRLYDGNACFTIHENGDDVALSSIRSLNDLYTLEVVADNTVISFSVLTTRSETGVYNVFVVNGLEYLIAEYARLSFAIYNDICTYSLGEVDTSAVNRLFYEENYYAQAESCLNNNLYPEALSLIEKIDGDKLDSYIAQKVAGLKEQIQETAYQDAFRAYINGNLDASLELLKSCNKNDERVIELRTQCSKELGIHYIGETVTLGKAKDNEWIILDIINIDKVNNETTTLLISKNNLFLHGYNSDLEPCDWEDSSIREYLNSEDFLDSFFSKEEQSRFIEIKRDGYTDKVYLLSSKEAEEYFASDDYRKAEYKGTYPFYYVNSHRSYWWLRSQKGYVAFVNPDGQIINRSAESKSKEPVLTDMGIRPVIMTIID